jgi:hypothetical protein
VNPNLARIGEKAKAHPTLVFTSLSLSELSDMFQNYLSLVPGVNGCIGNGKRNPRFFAMPA